MKLNGTTAVLGIVAAILLLGRKPGSPAMAAIDAAAAGAGSGSPSSNIVNAAATSPGLITGNVNPLTTQISPGFTGQPANVSRVVATIAAMPGSQVVNPSILASIGFYSNQPVTAAQYAVINAGNSPPASPGDTAVFGGDLMVYDPTYDLSGNMITGWHKA